MFKAAVFYLKLMVCYEKLHELSGKCSDLELTLSVMI